MAVVSVTISPAIRVRLSRRFWLRLKLAVFIMRIAGLVCPIDIELINDELGGDA